ncbi:MAG: hypothetical protein JXD21_08610 [Candidatus Omnitrophica bacterium]|nr:hypothetical protein [Candidatus Omnitrophota bacterium]
MNTPSHNTQGSPPLLLKVAGTIEVIIGTAGTIFFSYGLFTTLGAMIFSPGSECTQKFVCAAIILFLPGPFFLIAGLGILERASFGLTFNKFVKTILLAVFIVLAIIHIYAFGRYPERTVYERAIIYLGYLLRNVSWYVLLFFAVRWLLKYIYGSQKILDEFLKKKDTLSDISGDSIHLFMKKQKEKQEELLRHLEGSHAPDIWGNLFGGYAILIGSVGSIFFFYGLAKVIYCDMLGEACGLTIYLARTYTTAFFPAPFLFIAGKRIISGTPRALLYTGITDVVCWLLFIVSFFIFPEYPGQILTGGLFVVFPLTLYLGYSLKQRKTYKSEFEDIAKQLRDLEAKVNYKETEEEYPHGP